MRSIRFNFPMASHYQTHTITFTFLQRVCFVCSRVFFAVAASAVVVALASPLRVFPSMQKIASAAFYYALFVQKPNFLFYGFCVHGQSSWNAVRNKNLTGILFIVWKWKKKKKIRTRKTSNSAVFSRSSSTKRLVLLLLLPSTLVCLLRSFIHLLVWFFFQEIRE